MGLLWARHFLEDGAEVALWDRDARALDAAMAELGGAYPGRVKSAVIDITDKAAVAKVAGETCPAGIDVLVNNAGIVAGGKFTELPDERHEATIDVNLIAPMWTIKAFLPGMMERNRGHIVNVSSAAGFLGTPYMAPYNASKWGLIGLTESLKLEMRELGKTGVRFTLICPSYVDTGMFAGVKPPLLVPLLKPEPFVRKSYAAFKRDRYLVLEPFMVKFVPWLQGVLPNSWFAALSRALRVTSSMSGWKGR
jgi:short-subunit dehydrogenase